MERLKPDLRVAVLEVTRDCNLACRHCGSDCSKQQDGQELSISEWSQVIMELKQLGVSKIVFSGGEPFLKPGLEELVKLVSNCQISFGIISNGFSIPDHYFGLLQEFQPFAVGVSLDGVMKTHNFIRRNNQSWLMALTSLEKIINAGLPAVANTTISKLNFKELASIANALDLLGVSAWQLQIAAPMGRMDQKDTIDVNDFLIVCQEIVRLRKLYPEMIITGADCFGWDHLGLVKPKGGHGCSAGIHTIGIKANGDILPCLSLYDQKFVCGNVRQKSLKAIWSADSNFGFNRNFGYYLVDQNSRCHGCSKIFNCRGGCASMSQAFNGRLHDAPFCVFRDFLYWSAEEFEEYLKTLRGEANDG